MWKLFVVAQDVEKRQGEKEDEHEPSDGRNVDTNDHGGGDAAIISLLSVG